MLNINAEHLNQEKKWDTTYTEQGKNDPYAVYTYCKFTNIHKH